MKSKRGLRLAVGGALLGAVYLGLADAAMAWNEPLWVRQFGAGSWSPASGVAVDAAGNIYLSGSTDGGLQGPNRGYDDAWLVKYDSAGHSLWRRQLGTEDTDIATAVATDPAGNVYLTGWTSGSLGGPNRGWVDAWWAKYDAAGRALWRRQFGTDQFEHANGVATDAAGNVYLAGWTSGSLGGANRGGNDAWVKKYDAAGRQLWNRQLGTETDDTATGVATDATGNVYLSGETWGSLRGRNRGFTDVWLAKYDTDGHLLWIRQLGTESPDSAAGVATDATGNIYLAVSDSSARVKKYDPSGHELWARQLVTSFNDGASGVATDAAGNVYLTGWTFGSLGGPNRGWVDAWVAKYDGAGHALWQRQLGTEGADEPSGVATDAAGNVYLTGGTEGSLGGPQRGGEDAWVAKYSTRR